MPSRSRWTGLLAFAAAVAASPACADETPAPLVVTVRDTLELWRNTEGGLKVGDTQLNKFQIAVAVDGAGLGAPGWSGRLFYFRTNAERLSAGRVGDIQTVSSIDALGTDRLMAAWVERSFGPTASLRVGLQDLNANIDSIDPAGLFVDSSHGIGPDLSKTGLNGPSIFPVSSLAAQLTWSPAPPLTLRAGVFDGVPGDPDHPKAFAAVKLSRRDGALLIGQADWAFTGKAQASFGVWTYTAEFDRIDRPGARQHGWAGAYAFVEGPLPVAPAWSGWVRLGVSDPDVATVASYLGFGLVRAGPFRSRPNDRWGVAVARAGLGEPIRRRDGLPRAETIFEATYSAQVTGAFAIQPDVQYVRRPASQPGLPDALVVGLRLVVSGERRLDAARR